jgi:hypothetical protein
MGDTMKENQLKLIRLKTAMAKLDLVDYNSMDKLVMKMFDSSYEYGTRLSEIKEVMKKLLSGDVIKLSDGTTRQMESLIEQFGSFATGMTTDSFVNAISNSQELWTEFFTWLYDNYIDIWKQMKPIFPMPAEAELSEFAKYMERLSKSFEKNNKIAEFVNKMKELEKTLSSDGMVSFFSGKGISDQAIAKLKSYGVEFEDLKATLEELGISFSTFKRLFEGEELEKIIDWAGTIKEHMGDVKEYIEDFTADVAADWARMWVNGENAGKAFRNFFKNLLADIAADFARMIAKMIAEWLLLQAIGIVSGNPGATTPFQADPSGWSLGAMPGGNSTPQLNIPDTLINAVNRTPNISTQNVTNIQPMFTVKLDRKGQGWIVKQGNEYNSMATV